MLGTKSKLQKYIIVLSLEKPVSTYKIHNYITYDY